jgi:acetamidase/formamidase
MATHEVRVDFAKSLTEEPETGHNRWHPDIPPIVRCNPGEEVVLATRDALDGQLGPEATLETVAGANLNVVHPLTGPVYVNGAEPGDLLEIEILEVEPDPDGFTVQIPGFGFLRDHFPDPFMVRWRLADGWASFCCPPSMLGSGSRTPLARKRTHAHRSYLLPAVEAGAEEADGRNHRGSDGREPALGGRAQR